MSTFRQQEINRTSAMAGRQRLWGQQVSGLGWIGARVLRTLFCQIPRCFGLMFSFKQKSHSFIYLYDIFGIFLSFFLPIFVVFSLLDQFQFVCLCIPCLLACLCVISVCVSLWSNLSACHLLHPSPVMLYCLFPFKNVATTIHIHVYCQKRTFPSTISDFNA